MGCGSGGGCSTGGCSSGGCSTGGCNKLNTFYWLVDMDLPAYMKPFDIIEVRFKSLPVSNNEVKLWILRFGLQVFNSI